MRRHGLAAVVVTALCAGCYRYVPATTSDLSPGSRVRIEVPASRQVSIVTDSGPATYQNVHRVDGRVAGLRGDTLLLRESFLVPADNVRGEHALRGQILFLPDASDRLTRRRLDGAATTFAIAVPIGLIVYFLATLEFEAEDY